MPREMRGKGFLLEKTAREGAQVGRNREKDLTLASQGTGAGICPNSSTLPGQDSRNSRRYPPSSPGRLQALDPCASICALGILGWGCALRGSPQASVS